MRNAISNSILGRTAAAGALLLGAAFAGQAAMACTLANWSTSSGAVAAGNPTADSIARYSGLCAMEVSGAGYVQDNNPGGIEGIVARFYVLADNTATAEIYAGYGATDGTAERFNVTISPAGNVVLTDTATSQTVSQAGTAGNWNSIEIVWTQGSGTGVISLSVNGASATANSTLSNVGTPLQSVQLGNLNTATGTLGFDAYESRRSTEVGRLCRGEITGDGDRTVDDVLEIFNEVASAGNDLAVGQPDFDESGEVTLDDVLGVFELVANAVGGC